MAQAFYERPLRSISEHCNDFLVTYTNLPNPSRCEPIVAAFNTVAETWRRRHPCRGEQACNLFAKYDGTCANPQCTNFFCDRCETTNYKADSPCDARVNAETEALFAAMVGRGQFVQCAKCLNSHEFAGGCNHIT
ncbi:hypothetical protein J3E69DRAFT_347539 [Trichoderma sp. SZMC 28015]